MKTYVSWIEVSNVRPTYKQMIDISKAFNTDNIHNNGKLTVHCLVKMQAFEARALIKEILNCSFSDIRTKYHEKN